jgi:replicative DNA helicase
MGVLTLVVGHTGDGKSVVIKHFAKAAALAGLGALVYFVEDPEKRTADRFLAEETGVAASDLGRLEVDPHEVDQLKQAAGAADWADRIAVRFGTVSAEEVLQDVAATKRVGGSPLGLVAVDYAQAIASEGSMEETCASTARALNELAGARNVATVFGSQVVTEVLRRGRARWEREPGDVSGFLPSLGDAMWSRRLEQYAKAELVAFRPGRWKRELGQDARDDTLELHVPKANFGPSGWVSLGWDGPRARVFSRKVSKK